MIRNSLSLCGAACPGFMPISAGCVPGDSITRGVLHYIRRQQIQHFGRGKVVEAKHFFCECVCVFSQFCSCRSLHRRAVMAVTHDHNDQAVSTTGSTTFSRNDHRTDHHPKGVVHGQNSRFISEVAHVWNRTGPESDRVITQIQTAGYT